MPTTRVRSVLSAVLLSAAAMLGTAGTAEAALYSGRWDPAYGGTFAQLGWEASAVFDVPTACLALGNTATIAPTGVCGGFSVVSATLSFYNVANSSAILESFDLSTDVNVTGIKIGGGALTGVDTNYFHYVVPTLDIAGGGDYSFSLILYGGNLAQLYFANPLEQSPACGDNAVTGALCGKSANPAVGVFTAAIPEPETYALLLAGLGAIGFVARRRRS